MHSVEEQLEPLQNRDFKKIAKALDSSVEEQEPQEETEAEAQDANAADAQGDQSA